jgi:hypothetical protein
MKAANGGGLNLELAIGPRSGSIDILGLESLRTCLHLELNFGTLFQAAVSRHLDGREVDEDVLTAGALDKSVAFCGVKPFHYTFFSHY